MFVSPFVVAIFDRILFAKRIPWPIRRKKYAPEVGVTFELDSEHVEDLALHPISSSPDRGYARASFAVGQLNLHSEPSILWHRIYKYNDIELLARALRPANRRQIGAHIEQSFFVIMQKVAKLQV